MEDLQAKLEQYRLRKRRRQKFDAIKEKISSFLMLGKNNDQVVINVKDDVIAKTTPTESIAINKEKKIYESPSDTESDDDDDENVDNSSQPSTSKHSESRLFKYTLRAVYFLFWATLYVIAIELKFGIVFLMISALVGIYLNTRTGPKKENEISAYSVFNKNCESIDGTLKAEQIEKQLFYRADVGK